MPKAERRLVLFEDGVAGLVQQRPVDWDDVQSVAMNLSEIRKRRRLSPIVKAAVIRRWIEDTGESQAAAARALGWKQPTVSNYLRLLQLPEPVQWMVHDGVLHFTQARDVMLARAPRRRVSHFRILQKLIAVAAKSGGTDLVQLASSADGFTSAEVEELRRLAFESTPDGARRQQPKAAYRGQSPAGGRRRTSLR